MNLLRRSGRWLGGRLGRSPPIAPPRLVHCPGDPVVVRDEDPEIEVHRDCIYVPMTGAWWEDPHWGVYDQNGCRIDAADLATGQEASARPQNLSPSRVAAAADAPYAPGERHVYVGAIIAHYGHFLCSSMARLWALGRYDLGTTPLVAHGVGAPSDWVAHPYIRVLLGAAGVVEQDFANFRTPVRIRELIIPRVSFRERAFAHRVHAAAAHAWGDRLAKTQDVSTPREMVYISKTWDNPNPQGLTNEAALVMALQDLGVPIFYPALYPIPEQVALFRSTRVILGQVGSAFHTAILSEPRPEQALVQVVHGPDLYSSNHALIDTVNGNRAFYLYFDGQWLERQGSNPGFQLTDPTAAARDLLAFARGL